MADPEEIKAIRQDKNNRFFYRVLGGILLVGFGVVIGFGIFQLPSDRTSYLINVFTSLLSIFTTVFVIDLLNRRRDEKREVRQLKEKLLDELRSQVNVITLRAAEELRKQGWLQDGTLVDIELSHANLEGINLELANLRNAKLFETELQAASLIDINLEDANLTGADIRDADLRGANLKGAKLSDACCLGADFSYADLTNTNLIMADLEKVNLYAANLCGADLSEANLREAKLGIIPDTNTILPDGNQWVVGVDLERFTDSTHPQFWRSDDNRSPAYRGKKAK